MRESTAKLRTNKEIRDQYRNCGFLLDGWYEYMYVRHGRTLGGILSGGFVTFICVMAFLNGYGHYKTKDGVLESHWQAGALMGMALACDSDDQFMKITEALVNYRNKHETYQQFNTADKQYFQAEMERYIFTTLAGYERNFKKNPKSKADFCEESGFSKASLEILEVCIRAGKAKWCIS